MAKGTTSEKQCVHETVLDGRSLRVYEITAMALIANVPARVPVQCIYDWDAPDWPLTRIRRRNWFTRLFRRPSGLLLEEPVFNQWFKLEAEDEDFAIALLGHEMQRFMLTKTGVDWSIGHGAIRLIYPGAFRKSRMEGSLERLTAMWALVPPEMK